MDTDPVQETNVGDDTVAVQLEDTSNVGVKRPLVDEDKMVDFLEILNAEMSVPECDEEEQTLLETGDWCPSSLARTGDLKEVQGLFDKGVFQIMGRVRPECRFISMRMIRRWKNKIIKSRLCLRDVAWTRGSSRGSRRTWTA